MAQAQRKNKKTQVSDSRKTFIILGVGVLIAAVIAIGASGGSSNSDSNGATTTVAGGVAAGEYQPVVATGTALPVLGNANSDVKQDAAYGKTPPSLSGYNFAGAPVSVVPGSGNQAVMVVFLAHWCPHCNREVPRLIEWKNQGLIPEGLRVIGITTSSRNDQANWPPSDWIEEMHWPFEVMADSEAADAANAYGVDGFPFITILNGSGTVVGRHSGELEIADLDSFVTGSLAVPLANQ
jgi:thiol-disulfide isomerase/thioredoxin